MREEYERKLKNGEFLGALEMISSINWKEITPMNQEFMKVLETIDKTKPTITCTKSQMDSIDKMIDSFKDKTIMK